jgi:FkbM family methyltransferase
MGLLQSLPQALARRWDRRTYFARRRDWIMTLYDALLRYAPNLPLPLRRKSWAIFLKDQPHPVFLRLGSSDGFVLEEIFVAKVYEPITSAKLGEVKQIVDLGANVGLSVRLWQAQFPNAKIIAVEPDPANFTACKKNSDSSANIQLVRACVGASARKVYLDRSAEECAFHVTDQQIGEPIDALPLVTILDRCHAENQIDILKVDIEGAEQELFSDCSQWIDRVRNLMIELHPNYTFEMLTSDLNRADANFEVEWSSETAGNPLYFLMRKNQSSS